MQKALVVGQAFQGIQFSLEVLGIYITFNAKIAALQIQQYCTILAFIE